jgi:hypothetical protein
VTHSSRHAAAGRRNNQCLSQPQAGGQLTQRQKVIAWQRYE